MSDTVRSALDSSLTKADDDGIIVYVTVSDEEGDSASGTNYVAPNPGKKPKKKYYPATSMAMSASALLCGEDGDFVKNYSKGGQKFVVAVIGDNLTQAQIDSVMEAAYNGY
ncbi:hypothetical protein KQI84_02075 [bacterium]|nr:hypothetical protein [bacterium]